MRHILRLLVTVLAVTAMALPSCSTEISESSQDAVSATLPAQPAPIAKLEIAENDHKDEQQNDSKSTQNAVKRHPN